MPNHIRSRVKGGCYFFTVNLLERYQNRLLIEQIDLLREAVKSQIYPKNWGGNSLELEVGESF